MFMDEGSAVVVMDIVVSPLLSCGRGVGGDVAKAPTPLRTVSMTGYMCMLNELFRKRIVM